MSSEVPRRLERSVAGTLIDMVEDEDEPKIFRTPAGKAPASLAWDEEDFQEPEEDLMEDDEEIQEHNTTRKRLFAESLKCDEEYDEIYNDPDLEQYFAQFKMSNFQIIAMCRTYANYLAQKERSKLPKALQEVRRVKAKK